MSMIYRWKEEVKGFSASTKPTPYLYLFTSYAYFSYQPIGKLDFCMWSTFTNIKLTKSEYGNMLGLFTILLRHMTIFTIFAFFEGMGLLRPIPPLNTPKKPNLGRVNWTICYKYVVSSILNPFDSIFLCY